MALSRALGCFLTGGLLGAAVDPLRPLQRHLPRLIGLLAALEWVAGWAFASFGICRGDLRMGYFFAMLLGFGLWEWGFGPALGVFFDKCWNQLLSPPRKFLKKIEKKY